MKRKQDYLLAGTVLILSALGIIILANVSAPLSIERFGTTYYFLNHQLLFGFLPGLVLGFFAFFIPLDLLKKWAPVFLLINLILLAMVFFPKIGISAGGASRWLNLGPLSFQPSEPLKLTFILYLSSFLASKTKDSSKADKKQTNNFSQAFFAFLIVITVTGLFLILQPDISTLGIIVISAILIYFLGGTPLWQSFLMVFLGLIGLLVLIKIAPYRVNRLLVFLNPGIDPMGIGYQIKQSLIAVGSGGIFGQGLGMSQFKYGFLPQSISDSIFSVFAEETGFIGSCILIILFLIFMWRGFRIGKLSRDKFFQLTAWGITIWISLQSFINIGAMIGILPLTGVPLPFISYGGSALVVELTGVGLLLNISKQIKD